MTDLLITIKSNYITFFSLSSSSVDSTAEAASTEVIEEVTVSDFEADVIERLDTIIDGLEGIFNALWLLIGIFVVGIVIKFLWTVLSKWFFGGI